MSNRILYVGIDVHEKESQLAVFEKEGSLLMEERMPTKELGKFLSSLPGEKHVATESVGFVQPIPRDTWLSWTRPAMDSLVSKTVALIGTGVPK
jgi:hypothetical protein